MLGVMLAIADINPWGSATLLQVTPERKRGYLL